MVFQIFDTWRPKLFFRNYRTDFMTVFVLQQCIISKQTYDNGQSDNFGHYLTKSEVIIAYDQLINNVYVV